MISMGYKRSQMYEHVPPMGESIALLTSEQIPKPLIFGSLHEHWYELNKRVLQNRIRFLVEL